MLATLANVNPPNESSRCGLKVCFLIATSISACGQAPTIASGGIVNAASYAQMATPGSIIAVFGTNLADGVHSPAATPIPTDLGGTSVSINGILAPLFYVSPTQINAQVPSSIGATDLIYTTANVVVKTATGESAPAPLLLTLAAPGIFAIDQSGCGQALALNVAPDGSLSLNGPSNSAAPGDFVALFGTGLGPTYQPPPDGSPATAAQSIEFGGGFTIDEGGVLSPQYHGLAPGLVGVDQLNFQIPIGTRDGCAVPVAVTGLPPGTISPTVSISIHSSRGPCVDPPTQSYGTITLERTITNRNGLTAEVDMVSASFPSGPLLAPPVMDQAPTDGYVGNSWSLIPPRSCPVAGYSQLLVGMLTITGPGGSVNLPQNSQYAAELPPGFITGGTYKISGAGSSIIGPFQTEISTDMPIQVTGLSLGSKPSDPITVSWTGGSSASVVKVSLIDVSSQTGDPLVSDYGYASAAAGSFSFQPICAGNPPPMGSGFFCSFGIPSVNEVVLEQLPAAGQIPAVPVSGITSGVRVMWDYRFVFSL